MKYLALPLVLFLSACATNPEAARVQLSSTILAIGKQADSLEKAGIISNETEDKVINKLILIEKINLGSDVTTCTLNKPACIDSLLSEAIKLLEVTE